MINDITYKVASTPPDFDQAKILFREYADSLGVDLSFQSFENELQIIDQQYNLPTGALLLAYKDDLPAGCAGIRKLDDETAELKRMYVQDRCRGQGIGVHLLEWSLQKAKELGYEKIRLDTLQSMTAAQALYRSFGFYEIEPYRFNPLEGTIYMERKL